MNDVKWMTCTSCGDTIAQNATGICHCCMVGNPAEYNPDSYKNYNKIRDKVKESLKKIEVLLKKQKMEEKSDAIS